MTAMGDRMSTDSEALKTETAALESEVEALLACYVEVASWKALFGMLGRLAEKRSEGRIGGVMLAAVNYLSEKG